MSKPLVEYLDGSAESLAFVLDHVSLVVLDWSKHLECTPLEEVAKILAEVSQRVERL